MKDLKRAAYQKMLAWKQRPGHKTLEVSGARQVGKTYLVNKFADEQYTRKIYVNLLELSGEIFQEIYQDIRKEMREGKRFQNPVRELFLRYEPDFVDSKDTVVIRVLVKEKKGLDEDSVSEELQRIVAKDYSSNLGKASVNRAMDWLYSSGVIGFAGKILNCNILDFRAKARYYFMDMGLTFFFLKQIGCAKSDIEGIAAENFVYLDLKRRSGFLGELAFEMPAFATWGRGELDFYTKSLTSGKTYAIEVKAGKNSAKTAMEVLEKGKADYLLMARGSTHGGIAERIYTIPVYGISKFKF